MTQGSNERNDVKAELVLGQRQSALSLGPIRPVVSAHEALSQRRTFRCRRTVPESVTKVRRFS